MFTNHFGVNRRTIAQPSLRPIAPLPFTDPSVAARLAVVGPPADFALQQSTNCSLIQGPQASLFRKFKAPPNPMNAERGKGFEAPPNVMKQHKEDLYDKLLAAAASDPAKKTAIEIAKRQDLDAAVTAEVNDEFVNSFNNWLIKRGRRQDHVAAGWWNGSQKTVPKFIQAGGLLSNHPSVHSYVKDIVLARAEFEQELLKMKMEAKTAGVNHWPVDKLYLYYKYVVRGMAPDASDILSVSAPPAAPLLPSDPMRVDPPAASAPPPLAPPPAVPPPPVPPAPSAVYVPPPVDPALERIEAIERERLALKERKAQETREREAKKAAEKEARQKQKAEEKKQRLAAKLGAGSQQAEQLAERLAARIPSSSSSVAVPPSEQQPSRISTSERDARFEAYAQSIQDELRRAREERAAHREAKALVSDEKHRARLAQMEEHHRQIAELLGTHEASRQASAAARHNELIHALGVNGDKTEQYLTRLHEAHGAHYESMIENLKAGLHQAHAPLLEHHRRLEELLLTHSTHASHNQALVEAVTRLGQVHEQALVPSELPGQRHEQLIDAIERLNAHSQANARTLESSLQAMLSQLTQLANTPRIEYQPVESPEQIQRLDQQVGLLVNIMNGQSASSALLSAQINELLAAVQRGAAANIDLTTNLVSQFGAVVAAQQASNLGALVAAQTPLANAAPEQLHGILTEYNPGGFHDAPMEEPASSAPSSELTERRPPGMPPAPAVSEEPDQPGESSTTPTDEPYKLRWQQMIASGQQQEAVAEIEEKLAEFVSAAVTAGTVSSGIRRFIANALDALAGAQDLDPAYVLVETMIQAVTGQQTLELLRQAPDAITAIRSDVISLASKLAPGVADKIAERISLDDLRELITEMYEVDEPMGGGGGATLAGFLQGVHAAHPEWLDANLQAKAGTPLARAAAASNVLAAAGKIMSGDVESIRQLLNAAENPALIGRLHRIPFFRGLPDDVMKGVVDALKSPDEAQLAQMRETRQYRPTNPLFSASSTAPPTAEQVRQAPRANRDVLSSFNPSPLSSTGGIGMGVPDARTLPQPNQASEKGRYYATRRRQ